MFTKIKNVMKRICHEEISDEEEIVLKLKTTSNDDII